MVVTDLKKYQKGRIIGFLNQEIPAKFYEMGLMPGVEIEFKCAIPFGGPVCVELCENGCKLAILRKEAEVIQISQQ